MKERLFSSTEGAILSLVPGSLLAACGQRTWLKAPLKPSWYFPDFFLEKSLPYFHQEETGEIEVDALPSTTCTQRFEWSLHGLEPFERSFSELMGLKKAVPYLSYRAQGKIDPMKLIKNALNYLKKTPGTHLYGYWSPTEGMIGVTPELLFECSQGLLLTAAVAATATRNQSAQLKQDPKLKEEHQLVIDGIRTSLAPFGSLDIGSTEIQAFGRLAHLVTPLSLHIHGKPSFEECVRALHPTPALGTFPKEAKETWLKQYAAKVPRNRFGAPAGYCDPMTGGGKCVVAIRNIQWQEDRLEILCGCGITAQSSFQKEKDEIALKFESIKEIFGL